MTMPVVYFSKYRRGFELFGNIDVERDICNIYYSNIGGYLDIDRDCSYSDEIRLYDEDYDHMERLCLKRHVGC